VFVSAVYFIDFRDVASSTFGATISGADTHYEDNMTDGASAESGVLTYCLIVLHLCFL